MKWQIVKIVRVAVSLIFFLITLLIFVDGVALFSVRFIRGFLFLQVVPSVLDFLVSLSAGTAGFLFVTVLTLLAGRVYCSSVCPLGTFLDIVIDLRDRFRPANRPTYRKPLSRIAYLVLGATVISMILGNIFLLTALDPFALAGKFLAPVTWPADAFEKLPSWPTVLTTGILFITLVLLAVYKGRWYCTVICPVGTGLGLFSRISLFRIQIHTGRCTQCGICSNVCKAECIDTDNLGLDFTRCVVCFNCLATCREHAMAFTIRGNQTIKHPFSETHREERAHTEAASLWPRRDFIKAVFLTGTAFMINQKTYPLQPDNPEETTGSVPAIPPGSLSVKHYTQHCTACQLCVSACPTRVLQPTLAGFGLTGILQPGMDYETGYCLNTCTICQQICPTGAIVQESAPLRGQIQIGTSKLIRNLCLPYSERKPCSICADHCPTGAITPKPFLGELQIPVIAEKRCIGCGHCEYLCPVRPIRAIYVDSLPVHRTAEPPVSSLTERVQRDLLPSAGSQQPG